MHIRGYILWLQSFNLEKLWVSLTHGESHHGKNSQHQYMDPTWTRLMDPGTNHLLMQLDYTSLSIFSLLSKGGWLSHFIKFDEKVAFYSVYSTRD